MERIQRMLKGKIGNLNNTKEMRLRASKRKSGGKSELYFMILERRDQ